MEQWAQYLLLQDELPRLDALHPPGRDDNLGALEFGA